MRTNLYIIALLVLLIACHSKQVDYDEIASYQDHSVRELEVTADEETRVLLVFPHADDEVTCAGLTSYLKARGATIHLLTLGHSAETKDNDTRLDELDCSAARLGVDKLEVAGLVINKWDDIMNDDITFWYDHKDSIRSITRNKISRYKPHILITYDAETGGYGHPEHRISAELTEEVFHELQDSAFAPRSIYQSTLPDKLEHFYLNNSQAYDLSKELTGSKGLPDPDVSIDITDYWSVKNDMALCHKSQFNTLKKFYLVSEEGNLEAHARAFSKEYYAVVE